MNSIALIGLGLLLTFPLFVNLKKYASMRQRFRSCFDRRPAQAPDKSTSQATPSKDLCAINRLPEVLVINVMRKMHYRDIIRMSQVSYSTFQEEILLARNM